MTQYNVEVKQVLTKTVTIEAATEAEAIAKAEDEEAQNMVGDSDTEIDTTASIVRNEPEEIVISIRRSDGRLYVRYDVYDNTGDAAEGNNSLGGGLCTGNMLDTLGMAAREATDVIKKLTK